MNIRERLEALRNDIADVPSTAMSIALRDRLVARIDALLADWPEPTDPWKDAIDHELIVSLQTTADSFDSPRDAVQALINWHVETERYFAINPEPTGDWRDQIPWGALLPEIKWIAYSPIMGYWWGSREEPVLAECEEDYIEQIGGGEYILDCVVMPTPPSWQESKVKRPSDG